MLLGIARIHISFSPLALDKHRLVAKEEKIPDAERKARHKKSVYFM